MSLHGWKVSIPLGLDSALEGLTRAVLKNQPKDIYIFAAQYFEKLLIVRAEGNPDDPAHNAGLSPSSTQDSNSKAGGDGEIQVGSDSDKEKRSSVSQEKLPEEPESNDTSYGVEATAVRTLAATTGTVAILGTTAKTAETSKSQTSLAEDTGTEDINLSLDQEKSNEEHKISENSNKNETNLDKSDINNKDNEVSNVSVANDRKESRPSSVLSDSKTENTNKLVSDSKNDSNPIENHIKTEVQNSISLVNSVDNHQENVPDNKKAINDEPLKQTTTALVENVNDESGSNVLVNGEINNLPTDKDDVCSSEDNIDEEEERPETVVEVERLNKTESECKSRNSVSENSGSDDTKGINDDISSEQLKTNSLSDTTLSESFNAELDSVKQSPEPRDETLATEKSRETIISVGLNEDDNDAIVIENPLFIKNENQLESPVTSPKEIKINDEKQKTQEIDKKESFSESLDEKINDKTDKVESTSDKESPKSLEKSDNSNESIENNIRHEEEKIQEEITKPKTPENSNEIEQKLESVVPEKEEPKLSKEKTEDEEKLAAAATTIQSTFRGYQVRQNVQKKETVESGEAKSKEEKEDIISKESPKEESVDDKEKEKLENAATTIQATFRGYQTRQNIQKIEANESEDTEKSKVTKEEIDNIKDDVDKEKLESAATTIQATFRGYQTRQNIQKKETDEVVIKEELDIVKDDNISIDEDKEKLEQAATTIQATFRGYQTRQNIEKDKNPSKESFDSVKEEIQPVMSVSIKEKPEKVIQFSMVVTEEEPEDKETIKNVEKLITDETSEIPQDEDKLESAATKIQSSFRGYQVRKNLNQEDDILNKNDNFDNFSGEDIKLVSAATTIQAHFRGFQTRQKLSDNTDDKIEPPISLTPEIIESVKEEVDEICKQAEETTENMIKSGTDVLFRAKLESSSKSENEEIETQDSDESITKTANKTVQSIVDEAEQIADKRMNSAATRIQASFRGFQVRKNFDKAEEPDSIPDFPPSTDEDYLFGTPVLDDDLPPPDFEALESSYSEDVATEPLDVPPPLENLPIPESEEVSEASTEVNDDDLRHLQRPQECDELKKSDDIETSSEGESSLSSAATKIQAGIRGYLTRKHIHNVPGTGTTSTSAPSVASSDQSLGDLSSSKEEEGPVRSMISTEEETEIGKHRSTPEKSDPKRFALDSKLSKKRMSLDSRLVVYPPSKNARPLRAMSVSSPRDDVTNEEVWQTLQQELTSAATRIQSNYRGYRARKQLTRGDAVQMATTSSSTTGTTTPNTGSVDSSISHTGGGVDRTSGEYHDMIALTPPSNMTTVGEEEEEEAESEEGERNNIKREEGIAKPAGEMTAPATSEDESRMVKRQHTDTDVENKGNKNEAQEAATRIQAHYKGYKVRKSLKQDNDSSSVKEEEILEKLSKMKNQPNETNESKQESTRNSSDIENEAAKKIQAGFRGMKTRQELKQKQQNSSK